MQQWRDLGEYNVLQRETHYAVWLLVRTFRPPILKCRLGWLSERQRDWRGRERLRAALMRTLLKRQELDCRVKKISLWSSFAVAL